MRRTKEDADQTRQTLLDSALQIFSQKGFQAARLDDITQAAGVTQGAFYHHFKGKTAVYIELIQNAITRLDSVVENAIAGGGSIQQIGTRVLVDGMTLLEEDRRYRETVALLAFGAGKPSEMSEINQIITTRNNSRLEQVTAFMRQGIENGEFRGEIDPETAAHAFLAYYNGLLFHWLTYQAHFSIKETIPDLAAIFMRGLTA